MRILTNQHNGQTVELDCIDAMSPIDFNTCSPDEVIQRSIVCHPTLFAESITRQKRESVFKDSSPAGERAAASRAKACDSILSALYGAGGGDAAAIRLMGSGPLVIAFNEACRLQMIPHTTRGSIMARL